MRRIWIIAVILLAGCASRLTLQLESSLDLQRDVYQREIEAAIGEAMARFSEHGFALARREVLDSAYVFATRDSGRRQVAAHFGVAPEAIPETFFGTVDGKNLFIVAPDAYEQSFRELYGEETWSPQEHQKAIVHELIHRLHAMVAVERFATEEGMGPQWFFEGLAIRLSNQFAPAPGTPEPLTWDEIAQLIEQDAAGQLRPPVYPIYGRIIRSLERRVPIRWMIEHAYDPDFVAQLGERYQS